MVLNFAQFLASSRNCRKISTFKVMSKFITVENKTIMSEFKVILKLSKEFSLTIDAFDSIGCGLNKVGDFPFINTTRIRQIESFLENQTRSLLKPTLEGFAVLCRIPGMINIIYNVYNRIFRVRFIIIIICRLL